MYGLDLISQTEVSSGNTYYYCYDATGSTRMLTDATGNIIAEYEYDAFGNLIYTFGNVSNNYLFHGEYFDFDLRLYYLRARWMDTSIGRFRSMDEFEGVNEEPKSLHRYVFCKQNPISYSDPSGNFILTDLSTITELFSVLNAEHKILYTGNKIENKYEKLIKLFYKAQQEYKIPYKVLATLAWSESEWNRESTNEYGDLGIMQINPKAWPHLAVKEPDGTNINNGAYILRYFRGKRDIVMSRIPPKFNKTPLKITTDDIYYDSQTNGWYLTIWFYKGISETGRLNTQTWYKIHIGWPYTSSNPNLIKKWNERLLLLK